MVRVEPVTPGMFEEVYPLLRTYPDSHLLKEDWRRMLFQQPWPVEEPYRGFALVHEGKVVGFLGTIFSSRLMKGKRHRFCNLSSWIVSEPYRAASIQLLRPILAMSSHTILALTSSPTAHRVYLRLGFQTLEDRQWLLPPYASPGLRAWGVSVTARFEEIRERLDDAGREILEHMRGTMAAQVLVRRGGRSCHVIATRSPWKRHAFLAHIQYASDWNLFWDHPGFVAWAFFRALGTVGLRVDHRCAGGRRPRFGVEKQLALPNLYRPAGPEITPDMVDGIYSELVCQRW